MAALRPFHRRADAREIPAHIARRIECRHATGAAANGEREAVEIGMIANTDSSVTSSPMRTDGGP